MSIPTLVPVPVIIPEVDLGDVVEYVIVGVSYVTNLPGGASALQLSVNANDVDDNVVQNLSFTVDNATLSGEAALQVAIATFIGACEDYLVDNDLVDV